MLVSSAHLSCFPSLAIDCGFFLNSLQSLLKMFLVYVIMYIFFSSKRLFRHNPYMLILNVENLCVIGCLGAKR